MREPILKVRAISKTFPGLRALNEVSLEVASGEVVAVVGQNGSGKSTLVKCLAGVEHPDSGVIEVRDAHGAYVTGADASRALHFIHQDLGLIAGLSTVENLSIGQHGSWREWAPARRRQERRAAEQAIARFGAGFDVNVPVSILSPAERTIVAIARAMSGWTRPDNVLVLDEPTAALHGDEVSRLFDAIERVREAGAGVIFISHRLDEVIDLAQRVVALRDGEVVAQYGVEELNHANLVLAIAGRALTETRIERPDSFGETVLEATDIAGGSVRSASVAVRAGEIVGVTGILGSGREHIAELLFGSVPHTRGSKHLDGRPMRGGARHAIRAGAALVPADRKVKGAVMNMSVTENMTIAELTSLRGRIGQILRRREHAEVLRWVRKVDLEAPRAHPCRRPAERRQPTKGRPRQVAPQHAPPAAS